MEHTYANYQNVSSIQSAVVSAFSIAVVISIAITFVGAFATLLV